MGALSDAVGDAVGADVLGLGVADGDLPVEGGTVAVPLNRSDGLGDVFGEVAPDAEVPEDGVKIDGTDDEGLPLQAASGTEKSTVAVAQPAAVSLALLTLMRPPCIPSGRRR